MQKKLVKKLEFSKIAGVNPSTITQACKKALAPAIVDKFIDLDHPAAQEYIKHQEARRKNEALEAQDPLYPKALELFKSPRNRTAAAMMQNLEVGRARALKLIGLIDGSYNEETEQKPKNETSPAPPQASTPEPAYNSFDINALGGKGTNKNKHAPDFSSDDGEIDEDPKGVDRFLDMTVREVVARFGTQARFNDWLKAVQVIQKIEETQIKNEKAKDLVVDRRFIEIKFIEALDAALINLITDGSRKLSVNIPPKCHEGIEAQDLEKYIAKEMGKFIRTLKETLADGL